jgi:hypothetical protein
MGRNALATTTPAEDGFDPQRLEEAGIAAIELEQLNYAATASAKAIALQVGYDGSLSVGALEDEIRFYQKQTVAACLELGKRLLILKELTPHGQFAPRLALLGFQERAARRFMSAAFKTSKSDKLTDLSTQVKNMSVFLELITHDDDVIENIAEMDDVDKMSASELRKACRALASEKADIEAYSAKKSERLEKWERLEAKKSLTKETEEALLNHKARPLYELVAAAGLLAQKLENEVLKATDENDSLLKDEAYNSLTLITQYMLRAADRCNMPLDMEVLGLDATEFETKALGLGALDEKEEA